MYIELLINDINNICDNRLNNFDLYMKLKDLLMNIDTEKFNEDIKTFKFVNIIEIKNSNDLYTKYILHTTPLFDLIFIIWNKNSYSRIHDHPDKGCVFKILSGCLIEELYNNTSTYFSFDKMNFLNKNMISYKIGKKILHKIIAKELTSSLHIYIPGNYIPKNY
jgi:hypothetical protein